MGATEDSGVMGSLARSGGLERPKITATNTFPGRADVGKLQLKEVRTWGIMVLRGVRRTWGRSWVVGVT
jgi:hypothetical protein